MTKSEDDSSMSNGSLSDVQEEGSAMKLEKSDSNSMSVKSKPEQNEMKVPLLNLYPKKKHSSPIKDDLAV
jgi:hypothetical protein